MSDPLDLPALRALLEGEGSTPAPWYDDAQSDDPKIRERDRGSHGGHAHGQESWQWHLDGPDFALACALRNAAPELLDELKRLREERDRLKNKLEVAILNYRVCSDIRTRLFTERDRKAAALEKHGKHLPFNPDTREGCHMMRSAMDRAEGNEPNRMTCTCGLDTARGGG